MLSKKQKGLQAGEKNRTKEKKKKKTKLRTK